MTTLRIITLSLMAIVLVPGGAHLFELPGKIRLDQATYFTVQGIYAGWALFGAPLIAAILANVALYFAERGQCPAAARWALVSAALITVSLGLFFTVVYPANQETVNWTIQPQNWEALRSRWEFGHGINAVITFLAFLATSLAVVRR